MFLYLITKADFPASMSINVREERLKEHIENAQLFDVRPLMGIDLYSDMIVKISDYRAAILVNPGYVPTPPQEWYLKLLNGEVYGNPAREFYGINKAIMYYAYARFILSNDFRVNEGGNSQKISDNSDRPSFKAVEEMANRQESIAYGHWNDAVSFLQKYKNNYEYYAIGGCGSSLTKRKNSGMVITGVDSNYDKRFR